MEKSFKVNGYNVEVVNNKKCLECSFRVNCNLTWMSKCSGAIGKNNSLKIKDV